ncbi:hypothetical protein GF406_09300 [candidate division KSB1 bacterium]|nr:hypothetical protein [candidate division KSB1 bacterium]
MLVKRTLVVVLVVLLTLSATGLYLKHRVQTQVRGLFRMNKILQAEGYYMAEFEFKMMGIVYYLDKHRYIKALSTLAHYHDQLKNRKNLIKVPEFNSASDEMAFYLNQQNPRTGAFMDDSFPYCTFNEPTENVIIHLDELAKRAGVPLRLHYPLTYLDRINTPETLVGFLDDVSYVGWTGARFPETTFVFARSLLSYWNDEGVIRQNGLYSFSDEFETALLGWFYEHQDSVTGYWGPMSKKDGRLLKIDMNNTASIIKTFIDKNGDDLHDQYPLKYRDALFKTSLGLLQTPLPDEDELDEWHAWNISTSKGMKMLLRYLWNDASPENRLEAKQLLEKFVKIKFEKYYVPAEGAFSNYPNAKHASLDGTGGFIFKDIGAWSAEKQHKLWGSADETIQDLGHVESSALTVQDWKAIADHPAINSLRVYDTEPDYANLTAGVSVLIYPHETPVLDVMEIVPNIMSWLDTLTLSMGNWTSREQVGQEYAALNIKEPLIVKSGFALDTLNRKLQEKRQIYMIGFDSLQIPIYRIVYRHLHGISMDN